MNVNIEEIKENGLSCEALERITAPGALIPTTGSERELWEAWQFFSGTLEAAERTIPVSVSTDFRLHRPSGWAYAGRWTVAAACALLVLTAAIFVHYGRAGNTTVPAVENGAEPTALANWDEWDSDMETLIAEVADLDGDISTTDVGLAWMHASLEDWAESGDSILETDMEEMLGL